MILFLYNKKSFIIHKSKYLNNKDNQIIENKLHNFINKKNIKE